MTEIENIELEIRFMEKDKEHRSLKQVIDEILEKDKDKNKREYATDR